MKKTVLQTIALAIMPHIVSLETSDDDLVHVVYITKIKNMNVIQSVLLPIEDFETASEEYTNYLMEHAKIVQITDEMLAQVLGDQYIP